MAADRPQIDTAGAERLARDHYGLQARATELPSERDRAFRLDSDRGRFVLKIAHRNERLEVLEMQHAALARLGRGPDRHLFPAPIPTVNGESIADIETEGYRHLAQLLSWLPGRPYAGRGPATPATLRGIGRVIGRMDRSLTDLEHPALDRTLQWDARRAPATIRARSAEITDPSRRALAGSILEAVERRLEPLRPELRLSAIHNDINDHNLLLDDSGDIAGIIDFGDLLRSYTVAELAHTAAYLMMGTPEPLATLALLHDGYEEAYPLRGAERASLLDLVRLRLCLSVSISAHQSRLAPDNPYLIVSQAPAWTLLEQLGPDG